jgi:acetyl esterase/lipase
MSNTPDQRGPDDILQWSGHGGPVQVRVYRSAAAHAQDALLVFFHPGGFVVEDSEASDGCLRVLADACGLDVLAPSYALAPQHPFPAAVEDAHAVLKQAVKQRAHLSWSGRHLFVGGVEAGGNLAAVSALVCRDRQGPALAGQILVMPMLDASLHCPSMRCAADQPQTRGVVDALERGYRSYLPRPADRLHPYASPLNASRLAQLAPALILYTEGDPLSDEGRAYAGKLRLAGNEVELFGLPPADVADDEQRCSITADDPCVTTMKRFLDAHRQVPPSSV